MGRGVLYFVFQRPKFCCCLPVRACVVITSLLGFILAGLLSVILWFEVASTPTLTSKERGAFIGAGLVESLLTVICAVGFIGSIVHKLKFVTAYCIGLYIHFFINAGVAGYFLYMILHATHKDRIVACQTTITDPSAQEQCINLLHLVSGVFIGLAATILLLELYSAIVATRFVFSVREKKRTSRLPLHQRGSTDKSNLVQSFIRYTDADGNTVYDSHYIPSLHSRGTTEYSAVSRDEHDDEFNAEELYTSKPLEHRPGDEYRYRSSFADASHDKTKPDSFSEESSR